MQRSMSKADHDTNTTSDHLRRLIDKSPEYLLESHVIPQRVVCLWGNATKVIVVLRDPVDRTISHYFHQRRSFEHQQQKKIGDDTEAFPTLEDMIQQQIQVFKPLGFLVHGNETTSSFSTSRDEYRAWRDFHQENAQRDRSRTSYGILARSLYHIQIRQWMAVFRDAFGTSDMWKHLLILDSKELHDGKTKPQTYRRILDFLGLPMVEIADDRNTHQGNYDPVSPRTRAWLESLLEDSTRQLQELLEPYGIEMSWTRSSQNRS